MAAKHARPAEAARTLSLFQDVNRRIRDLAGHRSVEFLCECYDANCVEPVLMTTADYDRIRLQPTHFFVLPGHVPPDAERMAMDEQGSGSYQVVESSTSSLIAEHMAKRSQC